MDDVRSLHPPPHPPPRPVQRSPWIPGKSSFSSPQPPTIFIHALPLNMMWSRLWLCMEKIETNAWPRPQVTISFPTQTLEEMVAKPMNVSSQSQPLASSSTNAKSRKVFVGIWFETQGIGRKEEETLSCWVFWSRIYFLARWGPRPTPARRPPTGGLATRNAQSQLMLS